MSEDKKFDIEELQKLLLANKMGEAGELIGKFLKTTPSTKEVAKAVFALEMAWIDAQSEMNQAYIDGLTEVRDQLRAIKASQKQLEDIGKISQLRKELNS